MSVYRPKGSPYYHYDFQFRKRRFSGTTGRRKKPEAREYEQRVKEEAKRAAENESAAAIGEMTINAAALRFWNEKAQHYRGNAKKTFKASLAWIVTQAGPDRKLSEIRGTVIADLVARRRGDGVSPATVNRTVTEPLRRVLNRARVAWEIELPLIEWKVYRLKEPDERVREMRDDEQPVILSAMPEGYRDLVRFALMSGCRLAECVNLRWSDVDWGKREISILGKGDKKASIPLTTDMRALLFPLRTHHPERVFTYPVRKKRGLRAVGDRLPITYEGMKTAWRRARGPAEVDGFRFHDLRHTAATRLLRSGANIMAVRNLLRHTDVATTAKYAHVTMDDLRESMERLGERAEGRGEGAVKVTK
ncbi:integrase [Methylorubrum rhodinum]|uniref:Integrase n=1 Tax=Methylorubrum rhodinum TaxID=29428 RepID=A0A840ZQ00_9HYPH|nr:site-specific integrase [Methylorubrum rhodinum]MBB5758793.1 integrase [Methylorubrum rhodinum]